MWFCSVNSNNITNHDHIFWCQWDCALQWCWRALDLLHSTLQILIYYYVGVFQDINYHWATRFCEKLRQKWWNLLQRHSMMSFVRPWCEYRWKYVTSQSFFCFRSQWRRPLTQTQGCLSAWSAVILLAGLIVNIWLIRFLASGVTVSHSGEGNCEAQWNVIHASHREGCGDDIKTLH